MASASDNFTDTNGVLLQNHTASGGGTWAKNGTNFDLVINSTNQVYASGATGFEYYYHSQAPSGAEHYSQADVLVGSSAQTSLFVAARMTTDTNEGYFAEWSNGSWYLYKRNGGSGTQLAVYTGDTPTTVLTQKLEALNASKNVWIGVNKRISNTDNTITAANRWGVGGYYPNSTTGCNLDNWQAADIGGTTYTQTITLTSASTASIVKQVSKNESVSSAAVPVIVKQPNKILVVSSAVLASIIMQIGVSIKATSASLSSLIRQVNKFIISSTNTVATLIAAKVKLINLIVSSASNTLFVNGVDKIILVSSASVVTFIKSVGKVISGASHSSTSFVKLVYTTLTTTSFSNTNLYKGYFLKIVASAASVLNFVATKAVGLPLIPNLCRYLVGLFKIRLIKESRIRILMQLVRVRSIACRP